MSGIALLQPCCLARWNSVPNLTALTLSFLKLDHCVMISRSPRYFRAGLDQSCQIDSAWSTSSVCSPAHFKAMPTCTHSSREQSGSMCSKADRISSHDALSASPVERFRSFSFSRKPCHKSSSIWGMVGSRSQ